MADAKYGTTLEDGTAALRNLPRVSYNVGCSFGTLTGDKRLLLLHSCLHDTVFMQMPSSERL